MTRTIYKYSLMISDQQVVEMPVGAEILCVQIQTGMPCLWALVDSNAMVEKREILMRGTGHSASGVGKYISTFQTGMLVFHVFEAPLPIKSGVGVGKMPQN